METTPNTMPRIEDDLIQKSFKGNLCVQNKQLLFAGFLFCLILFGLSTSHLVLAAETSIASSAPQLIETEPNKQQQWFFIAPNTRAIYDSFYQQLKRQLPARDIQRLSLDSTISCHQTKVKHFYISVGASALKKLESCANSSTIFAFYLTQQQFNILSQKTNQAYQNSNIFFVDQPLIRQLALSHYYLPKSNNVGIIYNTEIQLQIEQLKHSIPDFFNLKAYPIKQQKNLLKQLSKATSNADFILATIDNKTYNSSNAKSILLSSYRKDIPLFGGTRGFVKAGIGATCYSVPKQLLKELSDFIIQSPNSTGVRKYPLHFEVQQNTAVLRSLNLSAGENQEIKQYIEAQLSLWRDL